MAPLTKMSETQRIAVLMGQDLGYCRGVFRGIHAYAIDKSWVFRDGPPDMKILRPLRQWQPHGIIAHLFDGKFARRVIALHKPLVNTTNTLPRLNVPMVEVDHRQVGRLAAEHFLQRGFQHFGYFGSAWTGFSKLREAGYRQSLVQAGYSLSSCYAEYLPRPPVGASWTGVDRQVHNWLLRLPKPVGILASNDVPARHLLEMCRQLGLRVPFDIAVLGVDNDELECLLSHPPLSSVVNPAEQIGYEAAKLLDRLMSGRHAPRRPLLVSPTHIVTRQSTDIVAIADPDVSAAVAFIRDHAVEGIAVSDVVERLSIARRGLERRFRKILGRSLLEELHRVRIERAKRLLVETDMPMQLIACRSGFSTPQRLAAVFRRIAGCTPSGYRRAAGLKR
ncbi:MAG: substrate-binding domain-containing protein, partial [Thermoguttaceae bacterium]